MALVVTFDTGRVLSDFDKKRIVEFLEIKDAEISVTFNPELSEVLILIDESSENMAVK